MNKSQSSYFYYGDRTLLSQLKSAKLPLLSDWSLLEPYISFEHWHESRTLPVTEQEMLAGLRQEYDTLPEAIRGLLAFDDFLDQRDKFEADIRRRVLATRESGTSTGYDQSRLSKACYLRLFSSALTDYGWQQLADGHQGLCIAISSHADCFQPQTGRPVMLKPVQYGLAHAPKPDAQNPIPGAFSDSPEHKSRAEWRAVFPAASLPETAIKLAKNDVLQIYVSVNCPTDLLEDLQQLVRMDLRYRNTTLWQVYPDAAKWRLTARPIPAGTH